MQGQAQNEPYIGWALYFPFEPFSAEEMGPRVTLIDGFIHYLSKAATATEKEIIRKTLCLTLDYGLLVKELDEATKSIFLPALLSEPELSIGSVGVAAYQVVFGGGRPASKRKINVRFAHYDKVTPIKKIKSNYIGKFTCVRGTIVRVGNIKPMVKQMDFLCGRCGSTITRVFEDGKFDPPSKCTTTHCRGRSFEPVRGSAVTTDWQKIRVQELMATGNDAGRVPRTIECELSEDMVDAGVPGDVVTVSGVVKVLNSELEKPGRGGKQKEKPMFVIYLDVNMVENCKQMDKLETVDFSMIDLQMITEIAEQPNLFSLLINSLCPTIYGHQMVKAGLMLALLGGTRRGNDKDTLSIRSDSHVLVVGDPGLGKSQLLQAVSNVAPRGVYVCGSYASSSGLTVTLFKEKGSGDYALEAGALILGDQGVCCIDEFDKMPKEHQSLLEAMEQQSISIAKAGIVCSLPARTAVIAAANPVGGHYNRAKTVAENLKMSEAVLSRFDLIFILLDKPDEQRDEMISDHVMALHAAQKKVQRKRKKQDDDPEEGRTLLKRIDASQIPTDTLIPPLLLRKYIAYARKYVMPRLSSEACQVLQSFYISLRKKHRANDSTPITTRQLESLIRLSEARAKAELREVITKRDAQDVVELMQHSLYDLFEDEYGNLDFRRTTGVSKSNQVKAFVQALTRIAEREGNSNFTKAELSGAAESINLRLDVSLDDFIDRLNTQNYLIKNGPNSNPQ